MFGLGRGEQRGQQGGEQGGIDHVAAAILPVSDMPAAGRFFERLGFRPIDDYDDEYSILTDGRGWQVHRGEQRLVSSSQPTHSDFTFTPKRSIASPLGSA